MTNNFHQIIDNLPRYVFESKDVKAFPTAYRDAEYDAESRTNSENRLTKLGANGLGQSEDCSYVIDNVAGNNAPDVLRVMVGGYYFEVSYYINDIRALFPSADSVYLYIKTVDFAFYDTQMTRILGSFIPSETATDELDRPAGDNRVYFGGLLISSDSITTPDVTAGVKAFCKYPEVGDGLVLCDESRLPRIWNGNGHRSIVLNELGNRAEGNNSLAVGSGTRAIGRSQFTFGEYNVVDTASADNVRGTYVEIVGGGDSATRKNIRTLK